ncbi:MAG: UDP-N-acetylglucosamine 2-epimerase (non-hydrolyzing) [Syntrophobacteraceae bacterium]
MKIMLVCGARPNFMKIASIISAIDDYNSAPGNAKKIERLLVHTGQHYDGKMSQSFFDDLGLPEPDVNLEVGSGSHAEQTAEIMKRFEPLLRKEMPDVVLVVGDVNSTIACSLVASKTRYEVRTNGSDPGLNPAKWPFIAHVEAGLRSFDRSMPEEINRILTDAISDFLFTSEESAQENLDREGVDKNKVFFVGNTMIDTLLKHRAKCRKSPILEKLGLFHNKPEEPANAAVRPYGVVTLHRPSNVDDPQTFGGIVEALSEVAERLPLIFPVHPRTLSRIREFGFESHFKLEKDHSSEVSDGIYLIEPLGYIDFMQLMSNARLILTDSGGMQEEATILGIPCITLRENTERPCTLTCGTNRLAGVQKEKIILLASPLLDNLESPMAAPKPLSPPLWDGQAGARIVNILAKSLFGLKEKQPINRHQPAGKSITP